MKKINIVISAVALAISWAQIASSQVLAAGKSSNCTNSSSSGLQKCLKNNPIVKDINTVVTVLSGLVGVVIVGSLIFAGIQYAAAGDNAQAVSAAKQRIVNNFIALLAYIFIVGFLNWLVPGGLFG